MDRIEDCISFIAGKAYQRVNQEAKRRLAEYGVTPPQYAVLKVLWVEDGQSGAAIGARLVLDSATMTGVIDRLSAAGFIERKPDDDDRRVNRLWLTRSGRALRVPLEKQMDEMNEEILEGFGAKDGQKLRALMIQLGQGGSSK